MRMIQATEVLDVLAFTVAQGYDPGTVNNIMEELELDGEKQYFNYKLKQYQEDMA